MNDLRLSVIIPVWNGGAFVSDCLAALEAQRDAVHEIIAVDNGSTDGSADLIADRYPGVRLFRHAHNLGFAHACNTGMKAATGDVFVLLNQDTRVEPGWAAALQAAFAGEEGVQVGAVGCKILSAADRSLRHAGGDIHEILGVPFHQGKGDLPSDQWDTPHSVTYVTGAAMAVPRRVVDRIGLFDERFFPAYYEDVDLCFRARAAGFKVLYWPSAVVLHHESTSTPDRARWFYYQRGRIRFLLKHWPLERLLADFAEAESGFQTVFRREFGSTRPLRLAYLAARIEAPAIVAERWPDDGNQLAQINELLSRLHVQALSGELAQVNPGLNLTELQLPVSEILATAAAEAEFALPPLEEFEFRSGVPVLGPLIALFRRAWHGISAKWALRHLRDQQQAVNQIIADQLRQHERAIADLTARQAATLRQTQAYLVEKEEQAAAINRFLLDTIVQAEEEAIFALLWPLRWDLVLNSAPPQEEAL